MAMTRQDWNNWAGALVGMSPAAHAMPDDELFECGRCRRPTPESDAYSLGNDDVCGACYDAAADSTFDGYFGWPCTCGDVCELCSGEVDRQIDLIKEERYAI